MRIVIGFGNPLRGDDGVGPAVAEAVGRARSDLQVYTPQQLLPELAEAVAVARAVVFVDAALGGKGSDPGVRPPSPGTVSYRRLAPGGGTGADHALSPAGLLALARDAYGQAPPAWIVTIQGQFFDFGPELSAEVGAALCPAVALVLSLLPQAGSDPGV